MDFIYANGVPYNIAENKIKHGFRSDAHNFCSISASFGIIVTWESQNTSQSSLLLCNFSKTICFIGYGEDEMKFHEYKNLNKNYKVIEKLRVLLSYKEKTESPIKLWTKSRNADSQEAENIEGGSSWKAKIQTVVNGEAL